LIRTWAADLDAGPLVTHGLGETCAAVEETRGSTEGPAGGLQAGDRAEGEEDPSGRRAAT
jgi:hypothetical protein